MRKHVPSYEFMAASSGDIRWLDQCLMSIEEERGKENIVTYDNNVSFKLCCFTAVDVEVVVRDAKRCYA